MAGELALTTGGDALEAIERELERDPRLTSRHTKRGYYHDLQQFEAWRAGRPLTRLLVEEYATELRHGGRAASGINRSLAAIRWWARRVAEHAHEEETLAAALREQIVARSGRVAGVQDLRETGGDPVGRELATGELKALLTACASDATAAGVRDAAIIALAWCGGLRRSELAGLRLADFKLNGEGDGDLVVRGKGGKVRKLYVFDGAAEALADWLAVRGNEPGPLFQRIRRGGHVVYGHGVSDEALAQMLAKRASQAGVSHLTWHDFRRTFAGNLLDNGHDLVTVQKLMGHASPITTSNYDRRGEEVKRKAIKSLHVPYWSRLTQRRRTSTGEDGL